MSAKMTQQVKLATYKNLQMKRRNKDKTISEILCTSRHRAHSSRRRRLLPTRLNARLVAHAALSAAHTHTCRRRLRSPDLLRRNPLLNAEHHPAD